ncbi:MAG: AAA family ATPase [Rhodocyclaceae bacterium]
MSLTVKSLHLVEEATKRLDAAIPPLPPIEAYTEFSATRTSVALTCAADVKERPIHWLWPGWLAQGKLTVLAGSAGAGKTNLALAFAAVVTRAGLWPDGAKASAVGNVIIWSGEDDQADTLKPRLMACGADLQRAFFINGVSDNNGQAIAFDPARDISLLRQAVLDVGGAALLILDPLVSAVAGDMHKANDVRRGLQALVDFAEERNCAVLGISHFSKGSIGTTPQERVIGSQAFGALARTVLVAAKQEGEETRVLARAKSNISLDDGGVSYFLEACEPVPGIETTRVVWGDRIDGAARDILRAAEGPQDEDSERSDAKRFLRALLEDGPATAKQVKAESSDAGHAWATIRRAQTDLGVVAYRESIKGPRGGGSWWWKLP